MNEEQQMENEEEDKGIQAKNKELYEWAQALVYSVLVVVLMFTFAVRLVGVDGSSMYPTLYHGDRLLVVNSLLDSSYEAGDIVVLRKDTFMEQPIVKRVIATQGQVVDIDFRDGTVYVDGIELMEDYINERTFDDEGTDFPLTVPEGSVFVLGDNRNHSSDSRDSRLGTVDTGYIIGTAVFLLFPGAGDPIAGFVGDGMDFSRMGFIN